VSSVPSGSYYATSINFSHWEARKPDRRPVLVLVLVLVLVSEAWACPGLVDT